MLWIYRFFVAFLRVSFFGEIKERVLNLAAQNKISLRNTRLSENGLRADISVGDFRRLRPVLRKSGIRVHILKKYGLPFKINRNRHRFGWALGPVVFILIVKLLSCRIWIIDVTGNKEVPASEIKSVCETLGIKEGVRISSVNTALQKQRLLLKADSLAWAAMNIEGCKLTVNVSEINSADNGGSCICNLKAAADGIIQKIDISSGNCVVKAGDTVKKGDILVSGILEKPYGTLYVHSSGTVTAITERSITVSGKYRLEERRENGNTAKKRVLELFSFKIPLYLGSVRESFNSELKIKNARLLGTPLPIRLYEKSFSFTEKQSVILTRENLEARLKALVADKLAAEGITDFQITDENLAETENGLSLTQIISSEENIALRSEFSVISDSSAD